MTSRRFLSVVVLAAAVAAVSHVTVPNPQAQGGAPPAAQAAPGFVQQAGGLTSAPARRATEGLGPFRTLTIRNVMVIDGTGAPPAGPMTITVEGNRITRIASAGTPGVQQAGRAGGRGAAPNAQGPAGPAGNDGTYVLDGSGMYLLPGFIDMHVHAGGAPKNADAEYAYKLWLAHGVTTVRGVPMGSHNLTVSEKARSEKNEIVAPRIINYQRPGQGWSGGAVDTPEKAREWVRWGKANGLDGLKLGAEEPSLMAALLDEAKKLNMGSTAHLQQSGVAQMNAIKAARLGLQTVTHFY